jgi:hypothetical protein
LAKNILEPPRRLKAERYPRGKYSKTRPPDPPGGVGVGLGVYVGDGVMVGVEEGVKVSLDVGVEVGVKVMVGVGVNVGPNNMPGLHAATSRQREIVSDTGKRRLINSS